MLDKVYIFIVTYNRLDLLQKCIDSIKTFTSRSDYEIIVLRNKSAVSEQIDKYLYEQKISCLKLNENYGNNAVNIGIGAVPGDALILILNDDTEVYNHTWLDVMKSYYVENSLVTVKVSKLVLQGNQFIPPHPDDVGAKIGDQFSYGESWCWLLSKKTFIENGMFDEKIDKVYCEDVDFSWRMKLRGWPIIEAQNVGIKHLVAATTLTQKDYSQPAIVAKNLKYLFEKWRDRIYQL